MLVKELKSLAIAVLIALLAIKIKGSKDNKTSDKETDEQLQNDLDGLINESENLEDLDIGGGTGVTTITRTTTASGTTTTGGTGGGY